jgi:hypothetical protein
MWRTPFLTWIKGATPVPAGETRTWRHTGITADFRYQSLARRSRRALVTTDTELEAIAAPAKIGESSRPKTG